ncbi:hypothetical protein SSPIM334S_07243 [Streptomyces spiroverticillatus]
MDSRSATVSAVPRWAVNSPYFARHLATYSLADFSTAPASAFSRSAKSPSLSFSSAPPGSPQSTGRLFPDPRRSKPTTSNNALICGGIREAVVYSPGSPGPPGSITSAPIRRRLSVAGSRDTASSSVPDPGFAASMGTFSRAHSRLGCPVTGQPFQSALGTGTAGGGELAAGVSFSLPPPPHAASPSTSARTRTYRTSPVRRECIPRRTAIEGQPFPCRPCRSSGPAWAGCGGHARRERPYAWSAYGCRTRTVPPGPARVAGGPGRPNARRMRRNRAVTGAVGAGPAAASPPRPPATTSASSPLGPTPPTTAGPSTARK